MDVFLLYILIGFAVGFFVRGVFGAVGEKVDDKCQDNKEKDFSHAVIHELRAYLTNLSWIFEKLLDKGLGSYSDDQYKAISLGKGTVENANNLVNDTLNAISAGGTETRFRFKLNDINKVIDDILSEYQYIARERKMNLIFARSARPIPLFMFDNSQMYIAIHDLVHNSMKYTPDGGRVEVATELLDNKVKIVVKDSGVGIPTKEQAKIFTKFFRAENAKKLHADGSGLGMYITKSIITRHKGEITLQSEENKGTTVEIILPLTQP